MQSSQEAVTLIIIFHRKEDSESTMVRSCQEVYYFTRKDGVAQARVSSELDEATDSTKCVAHTKRVLVGGMEEELVLKVTQTEIPIKGPKLSLQTLC